MSAKLTYNLDHNELEVEIDGFSEPWGVEIEDGEGGETFLAGDDDKAIYMLALADCDDSLTPNTVYELKPVTTILKADKDFDEEPVQE